MYQIWQKLLKINKFFLASTNAFDLCIFLRNKLNQLKNLFLGHVAERTKCITETSSPWMSILRFAQFTDVASRLYITTGIVQT